ncbi:hypothetical protein HK101_005535 [Irineochytrium annulatum]|nr:hypothetical protein HK101_005535 [Irineochytrium annulatum]
MDAWRALHVANNSFYHPSVRAVEIVITPDLASPDVPSVMDASRIITGAIDDGIVAAMGAGYSNVTVYLASELRLHGLPLCDGAATSPALSDPLNFPNFFRTLPQDDNQALAILAFISDQGWTAFSILSGSDSYSSGIADLLVASAGSWNLTVVVRADINDDNLYACAEIFVGDVLILADSLGMLTWPYTWMSTDSTRTLNVSLLPPDVLSKANGFINFFPMEGYGLMYDEFLATWAGLDVGTYPEVQYGPPLAYSLFYLTCFELLIRGYDAIIKAHPEAVPTDGNRRWNLSQYINVPGSFSFPEVMTETGYVNFGQGGDRLGYYSVSYLNATDSGWYQFATYDFKRFNYSLPPIYGNGLSSKPQDFITQCHVGYGRYSNGREITCLPCPKGTYSVDLANDGTCRDCPNDAVCPGGAVVNVNSGYWGSRSSLTNGSKATVDVYRCPMPLTCCPEGGCRYDDVCADGISGTLCTECADASEYLWNSRCRKCPRALGLSFWLLIVGSFLGACFILLVPSDSHSTIEILFFYYQVVTYIYGPSLSSIGLGSINVFFAVASLNVDGMASDCPAPIAGLDKLMFRFLLPTLLIINVSGIYAVLRVVQGTVPGATRIIGRFTPRYLRKDGLSIICLRAVITTMTFALMPLVETSLSILQCNAVEGKEVVTMVPQVMCLSKAHLPALVLAVAVLILLLGVFPTMAGLRLHRMWSTKSIIYGEDASPSQKLLQVLYCSFKPEYFYMLPVTIVEKGLVCIIFTLTARFDPGTQLNVHIVLVAALCQTRIYIQPYLNPLEAYLNREVCLGWLVMVAYKYHIATYGASVSVAVQVGAVIALPLVLHAVRWALGRDTVQVMIEAARSASTFHRSEWGREGGVNAGEGGKMRAVERSEATVGGGKGSVRRSSIERQTEGPMPTFDKGDVVSSAGWGVSRDSGVRSMGGRGGGSSQVDERSPFVAKRASAAVRTDAPRTSVAAPFNAVAEEWT